MSYRGEIMSTTSSFDSKEEIGQEIFDKSTREYLLQGLESYIDQLVSENFDPNSAEMIDFDAIEQEILENDSFDGIGRLEENVRNINLNPRGLNGWNSKNKSVMYAVELAGQRVWMEIDEGINPEGTKTAGYELMEPSDEPYYHTENPETLKSGFSDIIG